MPTTALSSVPPVKLEVAAPQIELRHMLRELRQSINRSMRWDETDQGGDYWSRVHTVLGSVARSDVGQRCAVPSLASVYTTGSNENYGTSRCADIAEAMFEDQAVCDAMINHEVSPAELVHSLRYPFNPSSGETSAALAMCGLASRLDLGGMSPSDRQYWLDVLRNLSTIPSCWASATQRRERTPSLNSCRDLIGSIGSWTNAPQGHAYWNTVIGLLGTMTSGGAIGSIRYTGDELAGDPDE